MRMNYMLGLAMGVLYILIVGDVFQGTLIGLLWMIVETLFDIYDVVKNIRDNQ